MAALVTQRVPKTWGKTYPSLALGSWFTDLVLDVHNLKCGKILNCRNTSGCLGSHIHPDFSLLSFKPVLV